MPENPYQPPNEVGTAGPSKSRRFWIAVCIASLLLPILCLVPKLFLFRWLSGPNDGRVFAVQLAYEVGVLLGLTSFVVSGLMCFLTRRASSNGSAAVPR
jgi:hypothetical protein